jgi:8-oxo-dGTP diphosphatase
MRINYCLTCAKPLIQQDETRYICGGGHEYWNNPRCGASVIFMKDGHILLSRRGIEPRKDLYSFPGGFLKYGESPEDAAVREMHEETGVTVSSLSLLHVQTVRYGQEETTCSIVFLAKSWEGDFKAGDDSAELAWKPIDFIDSDQFAWPYPGLAAKLRALPTN